MSGLQAVRYTRGKLQVLDQLRLPHEFHHDEVATSEAAFDCIKSMRVRGQSTLTTAFDATANRTTGAPAIAIVASLSLAVELHNGDSCKYLRPRSSDGA